MGKQKATRAAIYVRNADTQLRANQEYRCVQFAEHLGFTVTQCFWDELGSSWFEFLGENACVSEYSALVTLSAAELGLATDAFLEGVDAVGEAGVATVVVPAGHDPGEIPPGWDQRCHPDAAGSNGFGRREGDSGDAPYVSGNHDKG